MTAWASTASGAFAASVESCTPPSTCALRLRRRPFAPRAGARKAPVAADGHVVVHHARRVADRVVHDRQHDRARTGRRRKRLLACFGASPRSLLLQRRFLLHRAGAIWPPPEKSRRAA